MKVSSLATFALGILTLSASIAACSTTNNNAVQHTSATGQSCLTTGDCMGSDVCVSNVCTAGAAPAGDGGGSSSGTGTSSGTSSSGSTSGGSSSGSTSSGGSTSSSGGTVEAAPPHLGARGDACQATPECASGLSCISLSGGFGASGGICDVTSYGLTGTTTGGTCSGECTKAADCCELPVNVVIGATTYHNCNDIQNQVIGGSATTVCAGLTAGDTSTTGLGCFYFNAYCNGCSGAWTCDTTSHLCQYTNDCAASGVSYKGCAAKSRTGRTAGFVPTCNSASKCSATVTATGCNMDTDCAGGAYVPFSGTYASNALCRAPTSSGGTTDCTCYQHQCYLACANDLECVFFFNV